MWTTREAAKKLGLDESQIRRLLKSGEIKGQKFGRDWMVEELSYKRRRKPKTKKGGSK